jgi:hypothetical protein
MAMRHTLYRHSLGNRPLNKPSLPVYEKAVRDMQSKADAERVALAERIDKDLRECFGEEQ